ncbi:HDR030Wp [Eremothecium sinecaudum]|uniref:HDR030Wp n=1 Tax=Eremothecium sinecaudum TaxID=45286 RepID=A0A109UZ36_9SACH|nr:HDR030Wp [Eremothecium sinecaudum]AMD20773.1 HDR030Wp [Eremothecium sinecaudum]
MTLQISKKIIRLAIIASIVMLMLMYNRVPVNDYLSDRVKNISGTVTDKVADYMGAPPVTDIKSNHSLAFDQQDNGHSSDTYLQDARVKACFVSLVRNRDLWEIVPSVKNVEDRFNRNYRYTWVFLNDEPFTEEFKTVLQNIVSGEAIFEQVPKEHWSYPDWIDQAKAARVREEMREKSIIYGDSETYRHMCRFESGFFWRHPALKNFDWYWRVEPSTKLFCDIDYDVFRWMQDNDKAYGFTISIHEYEATIPTLWEATKEFIELHPEYIAPNNMMDFISDNKGKTYNLCHFWSNFEIASLNFWRSPAYTDYFEFLDQKGGFFYERWGDAPVHSIAVSLFLPKDKVHFFDDIGYFHNPYSHCPIKQDVWTKGKCSCNQQDDFTFQGYSCGHKYYEANNMKKPAGYEKFQ